MYRSALAVLSIVPFLSSVYEPDVSQQRLEYDEQDSQDRLVPTGSGIPQEGPLYYLARFGRYPSFSEPFEWTLTLDGEKYTLTSWSLKAPKKEDDRPAPEAVMTVELTQELAATIYTLWSNAILDASYSRAGPGFDGTTYTFSTWLRGAGWPSAKTWSPTKNLPPKWMVEAGEEILAFGRAEKRDESKLLTKLQVISHRFFIYKESSADPR